MKNKELKAIANKIAKYEQIIETSDDKKEVSKAQNEIMRLASSIPSMEDMERIDEMVMELLKKNS